MNSKTLLIVVILGVVLLFGGWINRQQQDEYLVEENRILRAVDGPQRVRLTDGAIR